jgi:hypothetical protein
LLSRSGSQQRGAFLERRTVVREDWALVAVGGWAGWGGHLVGFVVVIPISSVVPVSL